MTSELTMSLRSSLKEEKCKNTLFHFLKLLFCCLLCVVVCCLLFGINTYRGIWRKRRANQKKHKTLFPLLGTWQKKVRVEMSKTQHFENREKYFYETGRQKHIYGSIPKSQEELSTFVRSRASGCHFCCSTSSFFSSFEPRCIDFLNISKYCRMFRSPGQLCINSQRSFGLGVWILIFLISSSLLVCLS